MERISKELVKKCLEEGLIRFKMEDGMLAACIGDYFFYICDEDYKDQNAFSKEELINMIYETINDEPINDENEDDATECLYYKAFLEERLHARSTN